MTFKFTTSAILSLSMLVACTKKSTTSPTPTPTPTPTAGFTWTENGGTENTADSAYYEAKYKTIKVFKAGKTKIEINLTDGIPATYPLGTSNVFSLIVTGASTIYVATGGSLTITANASSKMTGTFTSTGTGASVTKCDGKFTDIAVR